jgi:protein-tyrosine-phosphatase
MGVDVAASRSVRVSRRQIDSADLILVMDPDNYRAVATEFPDAIARTSFLGLFAPRPALVIPDPYAATEAETRRVLTQIRDSVTGLAAWLAANGHGSSIGPPAAAARPARR